MSFASIIKSKDGEIDCLSSGVDVEHGSQEISVSEYNTEAAKEVDDLLRTVCSFADDGANACKNCAYRKDFFKFNIEES